MRRALVTMLIAAFGGGAASAQDGAWVLTARAGGEVVGCTLVRTDRTTRIEIRTEDDQTEVYATSRAFFTHPSLSYPITIGVEGAAPIKTKGPGSGEHGVRLAPNEGVTGAALLEGMTRAASMTVTEDIWSARFELAGLAEALPRLEACRKAEMERDAAERVRLAAVRADLDRTCESLKQTIVQDTGGVQARTEIVHPLATIRVVCPSSERASVGLSASANGVPPDLLQLVARVGAVVAGLPPGGLDEAPARCLKAVTGFYKFGKVGHHRKPSPDMPLTYEGSLTTPHATLRCGYVGPDKRNVHFWVGGR